jgi:L-methionine (R)-S-oxide reductase
MHISTTDSRPTDKASLYGQLQAEIAAILEGERDFIANSANCAALLFQSLPDLNWAGFYYLKGADLVLGPFQGKPACVRIAPGRGVCGAAAITRQTLIVPNVHEFPGHIACDAGSNSEIVIPLLKADRLIGVLDLDSPLLNRFDEVDSQALQSITAKLIEVSDC